MTVQTRPGVVFKHSTSRVGHWIQLHPLRAYFVLAFALAWVVEVLAFAALDLPETPSIIIAGFGPPIAAVVVTSLTEGRAGLGVLKRRLLRWRVGLRWYAVAFGVVPLIGFSSFLFLSDGTKNMPDAPVILVPSYLLLVLIMTLLGGGQEELGWRGYALAPLQKRLGALRANLALGVTWGFWHLPLYVLIVGYNNAGRSAASIAWAFTGFVGYTVALSMILGWVYNGTRASVLLVMLVHGSMNSLFAFAPESATASWCLTGAFGALALIVVFATHGRLGFDPSRSQSLESDELAIRGASTELSQVSKMNRTRAS